jgi:hypothetical protein
MDKQKLLDMLTPITSAARPHASATRKAVTRVTCGLPTSCLRR